MVRPPLYPGRIIYAVAPSGRGQEKTRPMIVAAAMQDIAKNGRFPAVVCSHTFVEPLKPSEVRLSLDPAVRTYTKFAQETVAVCDWIEIIQNADIKGDVGGRVPPNLLRRILQIAGITLPRTR